MLRLPPEIIARYRPATGHEVRSRSFGPLTASRRCNAVGREHPRGTLADQAVFGPLRDFHCSCGKYQDPKYRNMICDRCGVKVTTRNVRRQRFGHIDLHGPIVHPLGMKGERVDAIPILPSAFVESRGGEDLADLYDRLVRSVLSESLDGVVGCFDRLMELLIPAVIMAHAWNLEEAESLAFGLVLTPRLREVRDLCDRCGYPIEGLELGACPGCGASFGDSADTLLPGPGDPGPSS